MRTTEPSQDRLVDPFPNAVGDIEATLWESVAPSVLWGSSEQEIYSKVIGEVIRAARFIGGDEYDVELAASLARNVVAKILAKLRSMGIFPAEG